MDSWFAHVTYGVDFSVIRKVIRALEDFPFYFTMS